VEVTVTEQEPSVADQIAAALDKLSGDAARELGLAEPGDGQEAAPADHQAAGKSPAGPGLRAALFDVDGTLVDTNYLHTVAWWEAFARAGHDVPMASIHRAIGMGSDRLLDALLPAGRDRAADYTIKIAHSALYQVYWPQLRALPGAADLLRACHDAGLRVVLASSADPRQLEVLRQALDAEEAIDAATSAGDVDSSKPAPDLVHVALDQAGTSPAQTVFVGDDRHADIDGAAAVGMSTNHLWSRASGCDCDAAGAGVDINALAEVPETADRLVPLRTENHVI